MPRLLKRPEAKNDLEEIWWFIAQDSPDNADKFLDRIQDSCLALADFPNMGVSREELKTALQGSRYFCERFFRASCSKNQQKTTRPPMPSAAPIRPRHLVSTQQGVET